MINVTVIDIFGHLYDWDIVERITNSLTLLFGKAESEFCFRISNACKDQPFTRALVHTIRYMREAYPSKHITIRLAKETDDTISKRQHSRVLKEIEIDKKILQDIFTADLSSGVQDPFDITDLFDSTCNADFLIKKSEVIFMYNYQHLLLPKEKRELSKLDGSHKLLINCTSEATEDCILKLIDALPEKKRRILLGEMTGKTYRQLASEWQCSPGTIRYHAVKAKSMVAHQLNIMRLNRYDMQDSLDWE